MTHTFTRTVEERALDAMVSKQPVRLIDHDGLVGRITEIYVSSKPDVTCRITVVESDGRVSHCDLKPGAVEYL